MIIKDTINSRDSIKEIMREISIMTQIETFNQHSRYFILIRNLYRDKQAINKITESLIIKEIIITISKDLIHNRIKTTKSLEEEEEII